MKLLNIIVLIVLAANIILPFVLEGSANKWTNGVGWGLAIMHYLLWYTKERKTNP